MSRLCTLILLMFGVISNSAVVLQSPVTFLTYYFFLSPPSPTPPDHDRASRCLGLEDEL